MKTMASRAMSLVVVMLPFVAVVVMLPFAAAHRTLMGHLLSNAELFHARNDDLTIGTAEVLKRR